MLGGQFRICIDFFMHLSVIASCIDDFISSASMSYSRSHRFGWKYYQQLISVENHNFEQIYEAVPKYMYCINNGDIIITVLTQKFRLPFVLFHRN